MIRRNLGWKSVGHAGTLDPSAVGVLIVLCGEATRRAGEFMNLPKEYLARVRFGFRTTSDDFEGRVVESRLVEGWSAERINAALEKFVGEIQQIPPAVSAVKVGGRRSYTAARSGGEPLLEPRSVRIHELQMVWSEPPEICVRVRCSRGTYVRSLARDLGEQLGWGGALASLVRTSVGPYSRNHALTLHEVFHRRNEFSAN